MAQSELQASLSTTGITTRPKALHGEKTVDYSELEMELPQNGLIGTQIHGVNKAEVSFRNIFIQEL